MSHRTKPFTPQAGTIGARALLALAASETGRMSNAELLEAVGQPPGYANLTSILDNCLFYKLVETEKDAFNRYWTITEQGRETASRMLASQKNAGASHADGIDAPRSPPSAIPTFTETTDEGHLVASDSDEDIECALTSSGRLIIDANGTKQALSKGQTDQLLEYVDRMRGIVWEGGAA